MSSFWNSCLSQFEQELSSQQFNTWIRPLRLEGEESPDQGLRLLAPNGFILKWVKERYLGRIEELGSAYFSVPINISLVVGSRKEEAAASSQKAPAQTNGATRPTVSTAPTASPAPKAPYAISTYEKTRLIPSFTFDNLIVGKANDLARAASLQVAQHHDAAEVSDVQRVGRGVGAQVGRCHVLHEVFLGSRHDLRQHPTPFQFFNKVFHCLSFLFAGPLLVASGP